MLDVPCGDMQWMSRFLETRDDIIYTGFDIVPDLIERHQQTYADRPWTFRNVDIAIDSSFVNNFDLIITRHMLQHLDNAAVFRILSKLSGETIHPSFLLASTFSRMSKNFEIDVHMRGRCRFLNLELDPFRLEPPICLLHDGPSGPNYLGLWRLPLMTLPESYCRRNNLSLTVKSASLCLPSKSAETNANSLLAAKIYSCSSWKLPNVSH